MQFAACLRSKALRRQTVLMNGKVFPDKRKNALKGVLSRMPRKPHQKARPKVFSHTEYLGGRNNAWKIVYFKSASRKTRQNEGPKTLCHRDYFGGRKNT